MLDKERIKAHIGDFLRTYYGITDLKRNFSCVFGTHQDKHPSMSLHPRDNYVKCFSCGEAGDIFTLAQHYFGLDYAGAAKKLEELYPDCVLQITSASSGYCAKRGLSEATLAHFGVTETSNYEAVSEKGHAFSFGPAVCVPPMPGADPGMIRSTREKRFYKPAGQPSGVFFAFELDQPEPVFIVESVFCAMSIYQSGYHAIALNGLGYAHLLEELTHHKQLPKLILSLDNDEAGRKASGQIYENLTAAGYCCLEYRVSGTHKDPNEYFLADPSAFRKILRAACESSVPASSSSSLLVDYIRGPFLTDLKRRQEQVITRATGFPTLDHYLGGLREGLYVFGGRPGVGKTTFVDQLAYHLAKQQPVVFFSYEQSRIHFACKQLGRLSYLHQTAPLSSMDLLMGKYDERLREVLDIYLSDNRQLYLYSEQYTLSELKAIVENLEQRLGVSPVIIIDYIQKIPGEGITVRESIDRILVDLAAFTHQEQRTMVLISSFNRASYYVPISIDSYKESGNMEYAADYLLGLQFSCLRDPVFASDGRFPEKAALLKVAEQQCPRELELVCVKNKYGSQFQSPITYYQDHDYFTEAKPVKRTRL